MRVLIDVVNNRVNGGQVASNQVCDGTLNVGAGHNLDLAFARGPALWLGKAAPSERK